MKLSSCLSSLFTFLITTSNCEDASTASSTSTTSPNIIYILMDDFGYADISARGAEFNTPNLDSLYENSIILNSHYTGLLCSPSRAQILTSRYAWNMGISSLNAFGAEALVGIPLGLPTIGNLLKDFGGYNTYALGKWHVGYVTEEHTPLSRGFDEFYGFYTNGIGYTSKMSDYSPAHVKYADWWANGEVDYDTMDTFSSYVTGNYLNEIIDKNCDDNGSGNGNNNSPFYAYVAFQAMHTILENVDSDNMDNCNIIELANDENGLRLQTCQNIMAIDYVIGNMINKLKENNIWDNTLIIFTADNGGGSFEHTGSCNYPLKGAKESFFEGGVRTLAFIGGGYIDSSQYGTTRDEYFHGVDWLPTLLTIAGLDVNDISSKLANNLYQPIIDTYTSSSSSEQEDNIESDDDITISSAFDGNDYSKWLLYNDKSDMELYDNERTNVPLSINNFGSHRDTSIIFESSYDGHTYKLMDLGSSPGVIDSCSMCSSIACTNEEDTVSFRTTQLLFDLTNDPKETVNLVENIDNFAALVTDPTDDDYNELMKIKENIITTDNNNNNNVDIEMITNIYNEGKKLAKTYHTSAMYNTYISCQRNEMDEANPGDSEYQAFGPFFELNEFYQEYESACSEEGINNLLYTLYMTKYSDYKDNSNDELSSSVNNMAMVVGIESIYNDQNGWWVSIIGAIVIIGIIVAFFGYKTNCFSKTKMHNNAVARSNSNNNKDNNNNNNVKEQTYLLPKNNKNNNHISIKNTYTAL